MSALRRALWCAVPVAWAIIAITKTIWHPSWGDALSDGGAGVSFALMVALLRGRQGVPRLDGRRTKRQIAELVQRQADQAAAMGTIQEQMDSLSEGFAAAFGAAGTPVPDCLAADSPTQPMRALRAV